MSQPENVQDGEAADKSKKNAETTKQTFRRKVWEQLDKNNLVLFPRPAYGRIPNFKGSDQAAAKLLELDAFKNAKSVEVNPDKPQEAARVLVLEQHKTLYVPIPRLIKGLLKHITVPDGASKNDIREAVSRRGIEFNGPVITLDEKINIDLLVLGSVAVSKEGYRIGKGRGYADLEFGILKEMGAVNDETVIVTVVHDCQVFDTLPVELFKSHDVPVDFILTPTQIFEVKNRLPRPPGVIWNILSQRRVDLMPVLQELRDIKTSNGEELVLKEYDTDVENYEPRRRFNRFRRSRRRRTVSEGSKPDEPRENGETRPSRRYTRTRRFFRRQRTSRPRSESRTNGNGETTGGENSQPVSVTRKTPRRPFRSFRRNRFQIDFSLMVTNIERSVRVRDLKKALNERGIKPNEITWHGYKGFCYLHYAKPNGKTVNAEAPPIAVDNVIEILQNLKISPESEVLGVKVLEPVTRIETTDVTAV